jgi:hypothetical protein
MTLLSIAEAARVTGKDRSTINRYLRNGQISSIADIRGHPKIDTSELIRVFGELKNNGAKKSLPSGSEQENGNDAAVAIDVLKEQLRASMERERAAFVREERLNEQLKEREGWLKNQLEMAQNRINELEKHILVLPEGKGKESDSGFFDRLLRFFGFKDNTSRF